MIDFINIFSKTKVDAKADAETPTSTQAAAKAIEVTSNKKTPPDSGPNQAIAAAAVTDKDLNGSANDRVATNGDGSHDNEVVDSATTEVEVDAELPSNPNSNPNPKPKPKPKPKPYP